MGPCSTDAELGNANSDSVLKAVRGYTEITNTEITN